MADPIVNFFKSTLVGTYSNTDTSFTIATGDGALLPDPAVDGAYNLTIFEGLQVTNSTTFEIVRVTAKSGDVLTVTRQQEGTSALTIGSATHSILMSATKKTFDDINTAIANVDLTSLTSVEELSFDTTGNEILRFPLGTSAQRPTSPQTGYVRYNTDTSSIEFYNGTKWLRLQAVEFNSLALGVASATVSGNDATLLTNVIENAERLVFDTSGDEEFGLPSGTEAQRPTASNGYMRYNTDENVIEVYQAGEWVQLDTSGYYSFQGSSFGYISGGADSSTNSIEKYSFTSDGNATDVGDLTSTRAYGGGNSSISHGYTTGGSGSNVIDKFNFSVDGNATDVGDLLSSGGGNGGNSSESFGYQTGVVSSNVIEKFSFSTDQNSTDVGDLTVARGDAAGQSSTTDGYNSGGYTGSPVNNIDKFSFASDGNATDVGDMSLSRFSNAGCSSLTHGYNAGGYDGGSNRNEIDKFSFSSGGNATDVGDLTVSRNYPTGTSSTTHGYCAGGEFNNIIDKLSFSSDSNATDVGDLIVGRRTSAGQQV